MLRRVRVLVDKELRQLMRDPVLLIVVGWLYTVEVVLCAYALSFDLQNATLAVRDRDRTHRFHSVNHDIPVDRLRARVYST